MKKRILSILLALTMLLGLLPAAAFAEEGNQPANNTSGTLTITCQSNPVTGGSIYYKLSDSTEFTKVSENNGYDAIALNGAESITIKIAPNTNYKLDTVRGVIVRVNGSPTALDVNQITSETGCTINLAELAGNNTVVNTNFELEFGFGISNDDNNNDNNNGNNPPPGGSPGGDDNQRDDNTYEVRYNDYRNDQDEPQASVLAGGEAVAPDAIREFTKDTPVAFTLKPAAADAAETPVVIIEQGNTRHDSQMPEADEANNCYPLPVTKNSDNTYGVTFTPSTDEYFFVQVYWNAKDKFDDFGCIEGEIQLQYRTLGNGRVDFQFAEDQDRGRAQYTAEDQYTYFRQNVTNDTTSLPVTITPAPGNKIKEVWVGDNDVTASVAADGQYTWTALDKELKVIFDGDSDNPGENPPPGGDNNPGENPPPGGNNTPGSLTVTVTKAENDPHVTVGYEFLAEDGQTLGSGTYNEKITYPENTSKVKITLATDAKLKSVDIAGTLRDAPSSEDILAALTGNDHAMIFTLGDIRETIELDLNFTDNPSGGGDELDFTAVIWDGEQVEIQNAHGTVSVSSIEVGDTVYTYAGKGEFEHNGTKTDLVSWYGYDKTSLQEESGVVVKDAAFENDAKVYINFVFKPDYGYQVTGIGTNEDPKSLVDAGFTAAETVSTFRFEVFKHNNPHFSVVFSESKDVTEVEGSEKVSDATISGGEKVIDSGNLKMTVDDVDEAKVSDALKAQAGESALYLDMNLYQVVSKGTEGEAWENQLEELDNKITVTLRVPAPAAGSTYYVIREHGDGDNVTYDRIAVEYTPDPATPGYGTVTFESDKFSTYALSLTAPAIEFKDVPKDSFYADAVAWAIEKSVTNGTGEGTFSPDEPCTRADMMTFLWRAAGKPEPTSTTNPFKDVKDGTYYTKAVLWAVEKGITNGTSEDTFSPDAGCTRADALTMIWRFAGKPEPQPTTNPFKDVKDGTYYTKAVLWGAENGITNGTGTGMFSPTAVCSRSQAVTLLYRYFNQNLPM